MIERISDNSGVSPAADLTQRAASARTLCHTPFGDVMVDELSTPNLARLFSGGRPDARSTPAAAQPAAAAATAPAAQPAAAAVVATIKAAVAASTEQTAAAAATAPAAAQPAAAAVVATIKAAVAASTEQTAAAAATAPAAVVAASTEQTTGATADAPAQDSAPTAESVFGPNPWLANPTGTAPDGSSYSYNPLYFASAATAAQVAQMVGGTVVASDQLASDGSPFAQQQPNQMVELANGKLINPGLVASFYTHGYPQSYIDRMIQDETQGA